MKKAHIGTVPGVKEYLAEFTSNKAWGPDGYLADKGTIPMPDEERQQAPRVSQRTAYFHLGRLIEVGETNHIFTNPRHKLTESTQPSSSSRSSGSAIIPRTSRSMSSSWRKGRT